MYIALNRACINALGTAVEYTPQVGVPFIARGILDKVTDEARQKDGVYARLFLNLADLPAQPEMGDSLTVGGIEYSVYEVRIDAAGGAWLALRQAW